MSPSREQRTELIRKLVRTGDIRTQHDLVAALREHGCDVTQATVSRDVAQLDLRKGRNGTYVLAEDLRLQEATAAITQTRRAGNQVVLLTQPGSASSVAAALDAAAQEGVLGTIAGDDTILVITADDASGERFQAFIDGLLVG